MARRSGQSDPETTREEVVNVLLAELLSEHGIKARAERRSREGVPDLRVELRTGDLVLDCKWAGSASLLEDQLDGRLADFPKALAIVGVLYPDRLRRATDTRAVLEDAADIQWWLHGTRSVKDPERRVRTGSLTELADHLRALPLELEGVDRVVAAAGAVGYALEQSAKRLSTHASPAASLTSSRAPIRRKTAPPRCASGVWCSSTPSRSRTGSPQSTKTWRP